MSKRIFTADGNVGRFAHVIAAIEPVNQVAVFGNDEHGRRHAVHRHDVPLIGYRQAGHDVNVSATGKEIESCN